VAGEGRVMKKPVMLIAKLSQASDDNVIDISTGGVKTIVKYIAYLEGNQKPSASMSLDTGDVYSLVTILCDRLRQSAINGIAASSKEDRDRNNSQIKILSRLKKKLENLYESMAA
jgi:hypothetical protein